MTVEFWALLVSGLITYITIFIQLNHTSTVQGIKFSFSNQDTVIGDTSFGGRLKRITINNIEATAVFAPLAITGLLTGVSNEWTQSASIAFIVSRLLYFPSYALGLAPLRSIVWVLGFFSIPFFLYGLLF